MQLSRRGVLLLGAAGAALAGGLPTGTARAAEAGTADGADASARTERLYLSGEDADHPADWDFLCTSGRRSGSWGRIPVPSNWEFHGYGTYNYGWNLRPEEKGRYRHTFTPPGHWRDRRPVRHRDSHGAPPRSDDDQSAKQSYHAPGRRVIRKGNACMRGANGPPMMNTRARRLRMQGSCAPGC